VIDRESFGSTTKIIPANQTRALPNGAHLLESEVNSTHYHCWEWNKRSLKSHAIRKAVASSLRVEPHSFLRCGDWVRVKSEPLEGIEGILFRKKGSYRLILSLQQLGKSMAVEVDAFSVEPLRHRAAAVFSTIQKKVSSRAVR
jgi:hypothetical protein